MCVARGFIRHHRLTRLRARRRGPLARWCTTKARGRSRSSRDRFERRRVPAGCYLNPIVDTPDRERFDRLAGRTLANGAGGYIELRAMPRTLDDATRERAVR